MTDQHTITPPPELVEKWIEQGVNRPPSTDYMMWFAIQAARWGSDQELEACCEWCADGSMVLGQELRAARRPKPPSLKEQALDGLQRIETNIPQSLKEFEASCDVIRRALEQLDD